ncbi:MAG: ABC transporter ATP-binding protein [Odoribacteraceae bacterium]|nr:ABC transporter ATP-binding protein [Odoribacteraceae bacterium]
MESIIQCEHITHYYGSRLIYEDLNFEVHRGKILGLLGKNGTGKTTIINILNGYLKPRAGVCRLFGEEMSRLSPTTKARVGLLLEGHVQHAYFNAGQIERYYSRFFPRWRREAYHALLEKLRVSPTQKIGNMSRGQQSQVALGLLFAQDPELLILDDFSMGLDPGYRRLFVEYLKEFAADGKKTVFLTSHIIQDMEMLVDDCIILDYGRILLHEPTAYILDHFLRFRFTSPAADISDVDGLWHTGRSGNGWATYSFLPLPEVASRLAPFAAAGLVGEKLSLEDAFIGLTGKY